MASTSTVVDAGKLFSRVTMHVRIKGLRVMKFRVQLAQLAWALAARVAGCNLEIAVDDAPSISWQRVALQPGDVLLLKADSLLSQDQCDRIRARFKDTFPNNEVMVLERLSVQGAITRP